MLAIITCLADETNTANQTNAEKIIKLPAVKSSGELTDSFLIQKGFRVESATLNSMTASPVAMAFDERGRLFVVEMLDYPNQREQTPHTGQVLLLEDSDGDGVFDSSHVYADNLAWPSAVACYDGGIFVAATPEILYFKDTNGDGRADQRKVVFTGFGTASGAPNADALLNNFVWGLDHRIHGGTAGLAGVITTVGAPANPPVTLSKNDFSFDPKTLQISADGGPARTGLCFDAYGRKYVSDFGHPLQLSMFETRYFARNPFFPKPPELTDVISPDTKVFRFMAEQSGSSRGTNGRGARIPIATNGVAATWMSKPRGCVIYQGNAFPSNYVGNAFVCDPELHVIHRSILSDQGIAVVGQRSKDDRSEFLISKEASFHPSQLITGPEGGLYIADMQNGGQSGRILRIVPEHFKYQKPVPLARTKTYELVTALAHPNSWQRETAARLLYEQGDPAAVALLTNMVSHSRLPLVRMRALRALDSVSLPNEAVLSKGLRDSDDHVREHALNLSERAVKNGKISDSLWSQIAGLSADPSIRVQYQVAFTLGEIDRAERTRVLAQVLGANVANPWFQAAALSSVNKGASELLTGLAAEPRWRTDASGQAFLNELALSLGVKGQMNEVGQAIRFVNTYRLDQQTAFSLLYSLGEGLRRIGSSLALVDPQNTLQPFYDQSLQVALDDSLADPIRLAALRLRSVSYYTGIAPGDIYQLFFGTGQSEAVQITALATLGQYDNPLVVTNVIVHWPELPPAARRQAITSLMGKTDRVAQVIKALEERRIAPGDFSSSQINFLRSYHDLEISQRAVRLFGPFTPARPAILGQYKSSLTIPGAPARGREIFRARCANCHRLGGQGYAVGPDLLASKSRGKEGFLAAIIEPSREITAGFATSVLETRHRENLQGIVSEDNGVTVTIRQANGSAAVWPRSNIQAVQPQAWSLMPDGLEQGMNPQMMADLLDYLMAAAQ
jgi:putative membrane-bound dehydrogenase-like protein